MRAARRALALGELAAWTAALVAALAGLHAVGDALAPPPVHDPGQLGAWVDGRQPAEAALAVVRLVALGLAWYLLAVTVAGAAARAVGARALARAVDAVTVPAVRRLVHGAVGLSLTVAAVGGPAGVAGAHDTRASPVAAPAASPAAAPVETMTRLPDETPPTMSRLPDEAPPTMTRLPEAPPDTPSPNAPPPYAAPPGAPPPYAAPPGAAPPGDDPAAPAGATAERTWQVRPGDHFWSVAEQVLAEAWGRGASDAEVDPYWRALVEANRPLLRDPGNPDLLFPGQVLAVPSPPPTP